MYRALVRRRARETFRRLSKGEYESALEGMAKDVRHTYLGSHPCGGTRHSLEGVRLWFERVYRLFPDLRHEVRAVLVSGGPWNTTVAVQWMGYVKSPKIAEPLEFDGVHIVRFRWGRVTEVTAYPDSGKVEAYCRQLVANGVAEAGAAPIEC